jgi:hypothetical protein
MTIFPRKFVRKGYRRFRSTGEDIINMIIKKYFKIFSVVLGIPVCIILVLNMLPFIGIGVTRDKPVMVQNNCKNGKNFKP